MPQLPVTREVAPRLVTGAFILNSGLGKLNADEETAAGLHGMACTAYPFLAKLDARRFTQLLAYTELAVGGALLTPVVPTRYAGLALTGFAGGLVGLYLRTPGAREPGSLRPTQDGIALAKDSWLLAIGLDFLCVPPPWRRRRAAAAGCRRRLRCRS